MARKTTVGEERRKRGIIKERKRFGAVLGEGEVGFTWVLLFLSWTTHNFLTKIDGQKAREWKRKEEKRLWFSRVRGNY